MLNRKGVGFTLIELMVVVFVVSIGVIGAMSLISQSFFQARLNSSKLIAAYLVQEGVEIVRNIRDTNWIEGEIWDNGIPEGSWEADYKTQNLVQSYAGNFLKIDVEGFYSYLPGTLTKFKRKIEIQKDTDQISVLLTVTWQERGRDYKIQAFEKLYKWR